MRRITFSEGEFYHLYNRGVEKRTIFMDSADYRRFKQYLILLNDSEVIRPAYVLRKSDNPEQAKPVMRLVAIGAYCLMPNHFHLYVTPLQESGVSRFMHRLQTAYTMYFNERYERSGSLFQGTFKAQHVDRDTYARHLFSYIHLNPAKIVDPKWKEFGPRDFNRVREFIRTYPHSSLGEYVSGKHHITQPAHFPAYLAQQYDVDEHIDSWLESQHKSQAKPVMS